MRRFAGCARERATRALNRVATFLPGRIADEEVGDALEYLSGPGHSPTQIFMKVLATVAFAGLNTVREWIAARGERPMMGTYKVATGDGQKQVVRWILFCAFGLGVGLALGLRLATPVGAVVGMMLVAPITLSIAGSLLGASQSVAMRRLDFSGVLWMAGTAVGLGLGMTIGIVIVETVARVATGEAVRLVRLGLVARFVGLAVVGAVTGLVVGLAQRIALRRYAAINGRWVRSSVVAFGVGLPGGGLTADLLLGGLRSAAGFAVFLGVAGLLLGLLTARGALRIASTHAV